MNELAGKSSGEGLRITIVVARFNAFITDRLFDGALGALRTAGVLDSDITVVRVPGAWEIPLAAKMALARSPNAVIAIGCVIRGGTPHFEYVCTEATRGCSQVSLDSGIPVALGILTCDNTEQAMERAGGVTSKGDNKGIDAALAAIEMANLVRVMAKSA